MLSCRGRLHRCVDESAFWARRFSSVKSQSVRCYHDEKRADVRDAFDGPVPHKAVGGHMKQTRSPRGQEKAKTASNMLLLARNEGSVGTKPSFLGRHPNASQRTAPVTRPKTEWNDERRKRLVEPGNRGHEIVPAKDDTSRDSRLREHNERNRMPGPASHPDLRQQVFREPNREVKEPFGIQKAMKYKQRTSDQPRFEKKKYPGDEKVLYLSPNRYENRNEIVDANGKLAIREYAVMEDRYKRQKFEYIAGKKSRRKQEVERKLRFDRQEFTSRSSLVEDGTAVSSMNPFWNDPCAVYVHNLPYKFDTEFLKRKMEIVGEVRKMKTTYGENDAYSGHGRIVYFSEQSARKAVEALNDTPFMGRLLGVVPYIVKEKDNVVYVHNLPYWFEESDFVSHMRQAGKIKRVNVYRREDGACKGYGTVRYAQIKDAENAVTTLNQMVFGGRQLGVRLNERGTNHRLKESFGITNHEEYDIFERNALKEKLAVVIYNIPPTVDFIDIYQIARTIRNPRHVSIKGSYVRSAVLFFDKEEDASAVAEDLDDASIFGYVLRTSHFKGFASDVFPPAKNLTVSTAS